MDKNIADGRKAPRRTGNDRRESEGRRLSTEDRREAYAPAEPERRGPEDRRSESERREDERRSEQDRRNTD
ncbi:MAG: hypothetical protein OQK24_10810 [Magnetovibrio sp.]|nr:hypothetical protein [Magnetovibrio sp.]